MTDQDPVTGKFVKGNKANPGGRKRTDLSIVALIDRAMTEEDWLFVISAQIKRARRGDQKAIEWLTDRRFGKAIQQTDNKHKVSLDLTINWDNETTDASDSD